jgi:hypothetical protein
MKLNRSVFACGLVRSGTSVIVARFGNRFVLTLGGVIALLGLCGLLLAPVAWIGLVSFVFVSLGAANIVPKGLASDPRG